MVGKNKPKDLNAEVKAKIQRQAHTNPKLQNEISKFYWFVLGGSVIVGGVWAAILSISHEQRTWWSEATEQRKEVSFMTEQALYYSYFKSMVNPNRTIPTILKAMIYDDTVEHPTVLNSLKRFNVWPEVLMGMLYRIIPIGDGIDFYINIVFMINSLLAGGLFVAGSILTDSWLGGLVAFLVLPANYYNSTRVWTSVCLRECQSVPWIYAQMAALTYLLVLPANGTSENAVHYRRANHFFVVCTILALLSWQLAASVMALQIASLFLTHLTGHISSTKFRCILMSHALSIVIVAIMMFGNRMIISSPYTCAVIGSFISTLIMDCLIGGSTTPFPRRIGQSFFTGLVAILISLFAKIGLALITGSGDDTHMYHLLLAKYGHFTDFHTSLYLHMDAFLAMPSAAIMQYITSGTLPWALLSFTILLVRVMMNMIGYHQNLSPGTVFHLYTSAFLTLTSLVFYRLRYLWTPHLGIMCSLLATTDVFNWSFEPLTRLLVPSVSPVFKRNFLLVVIITSMVIGSGNFHDVKKSLNLEEQVDIVEMRSLVDWIKTNTPIDAVIAGDMSTMASIKLMADRRIANHPHYEDETIRKKTYLISHWFAKRSIRDVHKILSDLNITYIVNHHPPCNQRLGRSNMTYAEFVELGENGNPPPPMERTNIQCCLAVANREARKGYFKLVRNTKDWPVYRVIDRTVKKKSKSKATDTINKK